MPRQEKIGEVAELRDKVSRASALYFVDFTAVGANDFNTVRRRLRETGATVRVAKNRLAKRALEENGVAPEALKFLRGPTSLVLGAEDPIAPARTLREIVKKIEALKVKGAYVDGVVYSADKFAFLASLPTKADLQGQLVGVLAAPIQALALGLEQLVAELVFVMEELAKRPSNTPVEGT
ncbi:MAG: 50S ribosomal protein L10 [candidate division WOR-3 bacterium]